jgi:rapamycin-insensitive companion of mTOR
MAVLESHHFHHQMWCFAMNLFDKRVMRRIVLEEDDDEQLRVSDDRKKLARGATNGSLGTFGDDSDVAIDDDDD